MTRFLMENALLAKADGLDISMPVKNGKCIAMQEDQSAALRPAMIERECRIGFQFRLHPWVREQQLRSVDRNRNSSGANENAEANLVLSTVAQSCVTIADVGVVDVDAYMPPDRVRIRRDYRCAGVRIRGVRHRVVAVDNGSGREIGPAQGSRIEGVNKYIPRCE